MEGACQSMQHSVVREPVCLFHKRRWRANIEYILNLLRYGFKEDNVYFPLKYQNKLKSMLCICAEENKREHLEWMKNNEESIKNGVFDVVNSQQYLEAKIDQPVQPAFKQIILLVKLLKKEDLINVESLSSSDVGSQALLRFLYRVFSREFNLLSQSKLNRDEEANSLKSLAAIIATKIQLERAEIEYLDVKNDGWPELPKAKMRGQIKAGSSMRVAVKQEIKEERLCDRTRSSSQELEHETLEENIVNKEETELEHKKVWCTNESQIIVEQQKYETSHQVSTLPRKVKKKSSPRTDVTFSGEICLYHHKEWRPKIETLLNVLRSKPTNRKPQMARRRITTTATCTTTTTTTTTDISIPQKYVFKVKNLLCICKEENRLKWMDWLKENEADIKQKTSKYLDCKVKNKKSQKAMIKEFSDKLEDRNILNRDLLTSSKPGAVTFIIFLYKIICKDFSELEHVPPTFIKDDTPSVKVIDNERDVKLDGFPYTYIPFMIGQRGNRIHWIEAKCQSKIRLSTSTEANDEKSVWANITKFTKNTKITPPKSFEEIIEILNSEVKRIIARRLAHQQAVKAYQKTRGRRLKNWTEQMKKRNAFLDTNLLPSNSSNIKYVNAEHYHRKHKGDQPYIKKRKEPVLAGSRCLYCLGPFDKKASQSDACVYHPGFIKEIRTYIPDEDLMGEGEYICSTVWSCCEETCYASHVTHDLHKSTGCQKGHHNWRPTGGKVAAKKGKDKLTYDSTE